VEISCFFVDFCIPVRQEKPALRSPVPSAPVDVERSGELTVSKVLVIVYDPVVDTLTVKNCRSNWAGSARKT
jgi:hypothetical protein